MATSEFEKAVKELLDLGQRVRTAFMCSEAVYWRCHRRLVSDYLVLHDVAVQRIMPNSELRNHTLTEGVKFTDGILAYVPAQEGTGLTLFD